MRHDRSESATGQPFEAVRRMDRDAAASIARDVLSRGSLVALEIDHRLDDFTAALITDPVALGAGRPLADLNSKRPAEALDELHAALIMRFAAVQTVFVEDEYALRRDRNAPGCAFVDDRVLRWVAVDGTGVDAARSMRAGPPGVPLVAYLSSIAAGAVVAWPGGNLTSAAIGQLADSIAAIAVPFDDSDSLVFLSRSNVLP